jgi:uncharacterized membrane protein
MSEPTPSPRGHRPLTLRQFEWLRSQLTAWAREDLLSPEQMAGILARYPSEEELLGGRSRRLHVALFSLACVMFAAGVLLVIGYNWAELGRGAKLALIFFAVASAFAGSAIAYRRSRALLGEVLAFVATLLYGNAIWLLAQVFHIQAHYPDGLLWWMIGALLTAHALRSRLIGLQAIVLLSVWTSMEAGFGNANYLFLPFAALAVWLAYRTQARLLVGLSALAMMGWLWAAGLEGWDVPRETAALLVLGGCALFAFGMLAQGTAALARVWGAVGVLVVLMALIPMTFTEYHQPWWGMAPERSTPLRIATLLLLAFVAGRFFRGRPGSFREATPVLVAALASAAYAFLTAEIARNQEVSFALFAAIGFSGLSVLLALWLILRGVRLERGLSFFAGVVYLLIFVMVRWVDLIGDMLSSAAVFFIASLVLYATARFWGGRHARVGARGVDV